MELAVRCATGARGAGFEEHIEALRAVWGPDPVRFQGRFYQIPESEIGPKPVREGGPPLLVGADQVFWSMVDTDPDEQLHGLEGLLAREAR
jgi:hypothetical protein